MHAAAFYILLVALPGQPAYQWRVEGGYDSCQLAEEMLHRYTTTPIATQCLSSAAWEAAGRPGLMPGKLAP